MYKTITTRRNFQISPFNSLEVIETMAEIPEHLVNDQQFLNYVHAQQLGDVERQYRRYRRLIEKELPNELDPDLYLDTLNVQTQNLINEHLHSIDVPNKNTGD